MTNHNNFFVALGRVILGLFFIGVGALNLGCFQENLSVLIAHGIPVATVFLSFGIAVQMILGAFLALGRLQRTAACLLILFTVIVAPFYLDFWNMVGAARTATLIQFLSDIAIIGGLLMIVGTKKHCKKDVE